MKTTRRTFLQAAAAASLLHSLPAFAAPMKIGIIGSGRVGSNVGGAWVKAGHEVMFSSLDLESDKKLAASLGGRAGGGCVARDRLLARPQLPA